MVNVYADIARSENLPPALYLTADCKICCQKLDQKPNPKCIPSLVHRWLSTDQKDTFDVDKEKDSTDLALSWDGDESDWNEAARWENNIAWIEASI